MTNKNTKVKDKLYDEGMLEASYNYWFKDNEHVRTPFPEYIREELKIISKQKYIDWLEKLKDEALDEINDEILVERFEECLFDSAVSMVKTEDEKLTIYYPFLPRLNDVIDVKGPGESIIPSKVIKREKINRNDHKYLKVSLLNEIENKEWETEFELPE
jgi:hypothetical protein